MTTFYREPLPDASIYVIASFAIWRERLGEPLLKTEPILKIIPVPQLVG
jgi:hypothetical protein